MYCNLIQIFSLARYSGASFPGNARQYFPWEIEQCRVPVPFDCSSGLESYLTKQWITSFVRVIISEKVHSKSSVMIHGGKMLRELLVMTTRVHQPVRI